MRATTLQQRAYARLQCAAEPEASGIRRGEDRWGAEALKCYAEGYPLRAIEATALRNLYEYRDRAQLPKFAERSIKTTAHQVPKQSAE
jgi:hypothetical protein